jgi:hypothetical protein
MRRILALVLGFALLATAASAQDARVNENTPIYINPSPAPNTPPLRVAAVGTLLKVVGQDGEWLRIEFQDPQWGRRTGWVRASAVTVSRPELQPMDLSIRETPATPATPAGGQYQPVPARASTPLYRTRIVGRSGITFGTETATLFGVDVTGDVLPVLGVYGSFDWHQNVAPKWVQDLGDLIGDIVGADVAYKFPSYVGLGGAKVQVPGRVLRPYGVGGFGVGHVRGTVEVEGDDVTDLFEELGYLDKDDVEFTKPLFEVGGGLGIAVGRGYIDASYRFRKFVDVGEAINISGVYVGGGVSF